MLGHLPERKNRVFLKLYNENRYFSLQTEYENNSLE
jgi:hypothetical protein